MDVPYPQPRKFILELLTKVEMVYTGLNLEQNAIAFSLRRAERGQPRLDRQPTPAVSGPPAEDGPKAANRPRSLQIQ